MNEIRQIRQSLGISQRELANLLSIPKSAISMAENGQRPLPAEMLIYIRLMNEQNTLTDALHPEIETEMSRRRGEFNEQLKAEYRAKMARIEVQLVNLDKELESQVEIMNELRSKLLLLSTELAATLPGSRQHGIIFSEINRLLDLQYKPHALRYQLLEVKRNCLQAELDGYRAVLGE